MSLTFGQSLPRSKYTCPWIVGKTSYSMMGFEKPHPLLGTKNFPSTFFLYFPLHEISMHNYKHFKEHIMNNKKNT